MQLILLGIRLYPTLLTVFVRPLSAFWVFAPFPSIEFSLFLATSLSPPKQGSQGLSPGWILLIFSQLAILPSHCNKHQVVVVVVVVYTTFNISQLAILSSHCNKHQVVVVVVVVIPHICHRHHRHVCVKVFCPV